MIEVCESGTLKFNSKKYHCAIGVNGIKKNKKKGMALLPVENSLLVLFFIAKIEFLI